MAVIILGTPESSVNQLKSFSIALRQYFSKWNMVKTRKMAQHHRASLSKQHIVLVIVMANKTDSNSVCDCPLSVRAATMDTRAWAKQIVS